MVQMAFLPAPAFCSWSVAVTDARTTQTATAVSITPPAVGGPFDRFDLSVCPMPASGEPDWDSCPQTTCLPAQAAACPVSGLTRNTSYTVSAVAFLGATSTQRAAADEFVTLPWP